MSTFKSMLFNDYKVIERQFNMTSLYGPTFHSGKFMVPINDKEKFLDNYFQYVFVNNQNCHFLLSQVHLFYCLYKQMQLLEMLLKRKE